MTYLRLSIHPFLSHLLTKSSLVLFTSLNIEATLINHHTIAQSKEKLIQLQSSCICPTLCRDLFGELVQLARTDIVQHVVIESTGISEPMQVAQTFTSGFSKTMIEQKKLLGDESGILKQM